MQSSNDIFKSFDKVYICGYVLKELDKHKVSISEDKKFQARRAGRDIEANIHKIEYVINEGIYDLPPSFEKENMDNKIISIFNQVYESDDDVIGLSNDLLFRQKCKMLKLPCEKFGDSFSNSIYKGYQRLSGNTDFVNNFFSDIDNEVNEYQFVINEYLIMHNTDTKQVSEHRFNGKRFVALKLPDSNVIKGKNGLQRCALDLLGNKSIPIVAINGTVGSGKTFLCVRMALHQVIDKGDFGKVLAVREAIGEGKEVGFLKGTFEEKTEMFFKPIVHSLEGGESELSSLVSQGVLESNIPFYLKGTTYDDTVIVCDESEDLSKKQLKLVGTRLGENSKIYLAGDYRQSSVDSSERNALVSMCNELKGTKEFGCVYLEKDVRSTASSIFSELFTK